MINRCINSIVANEKAIDNIGYYSDYSNSYLYLKDISEDLDSNYQYKMLINNCIDGLLVARPGGIYDEASLIYDVTSLSSLISCYKNSTISYQAIKELLYQIMGVFEEIKEYMLEERYIQLSPELVFYPVAHGAIRLLYIPSYEWAGGFSRLAEFLMDKADYKDDVATRLVYRLYKACREEFFSLRVFLMVLEREENTKDEHKDNRITNSNNYKESSRYSIDGESIVGSVCSNENLLNSSGSYMEDNMHQRGLSEIHDGEVVNGIRKGKDNCENRGIYTDKDSKSIILNSKKSAHSFYIMLGLVGLLSTIAIYIYIPLSINSLVILIGSGIVAFISLVYGLILCRLSGIISRCRMNSDINRDNGLETDKNNVQKKGEKPKLITNNSQRIKRYEYDMDIEPEAYWKGIAESIEYGDSNDYIEEETVFFNNHNKENTLIQEEGLHIAWIENNIEKTYIIYQYPVRVGKQSGKSDLLINDISVSRMHAQFDQCEDSVVIWDLGSKNGTYVNGVKILPGEAHRVCEGDEVKFGNIVTQISSR